MKKLLLEVMKFSLAGLPSKRELIDITSLDKMLIPEEIFEMEWYLNRSRTVSFRIITEEINGE